MFNYLILETISYILGGVIIVVLCIHLIRIPRIRNIVKKRGIYIPVILFILVFFVGIISNKTYAPDFAMPAFLHSEAPGGMAPSIPFPKIVEFFKEFRNFEQVADIGVDASAVPSIAQLPDEDGIVRIHLTAEEVISEVAPGIYFNYWTYNRQVPGPMLRVREGDTIELTLTNHKSSLHPHNIDLHAVTGPGGGAVLTDVKPGETKTFRWKALNPGLFIYHCATPNVSTHNSHGQYGLILVDPKDPANALAKVDKEFYIVQGELYTIGQLGKKGLAPFDSNALLSGNPNYVTFNGKIESVPRLKAQVGDKIRIYVGNGGVNLTSAFHVIGEIFDKVYPNGSMGVDSAIEKNTQTALVLPGGSSIVEFDLNVPGKYLLVDHALARMNKGAWATLEVTGDAQPDIFSPVNR